MASASGGAEGLQKTTASFKLCIREHFGFPVNYTQEGIGLQIWRRCLTHAMTFHYEDYRKQITDKQITGKDLNCQWIILLLQCYRHAHTGTHLAQVLIGAIAEWKLERHNIPVTTDNVKSQVNVVVEAGLFFDAKGYFVQKNIVSSCLILHFNLTFDHWIHFKI